MRKYFRINHLSTDLLQHYKDSPTNGGRYPYLTMFLGKDFAHNTGSFLKTV